MPSRITLPVEPRRTTWILALVAGCLVLLHVVVMLLCYAGPLERGDWWHEVALFDLDEEESFGTWFSAVILLYAGRLLLLTARVDRARDRRLRCWWLFLGIGFHALSIDEIVGLHELLNTRQDTPWTTYAYFVVAVVALACIPLLVWLPARTRHLFVAAGALYVGGAVVLERATDWYEPAGLLNTLRYNLLTGVEEALEMAGVILFVYALLDHLRRTAGDAAAPPPDLPD